MTSMLLQKTNFGYNIGEQMLETPIGFDAVTTSCIEKFQQSCNSDCWKPKTSMCDVYHRL